MKREIEKEELRYKYRVRCREMCIYTYIPKYIH